jgi:hypothetical protein
MIRLRNEHVTTLETQDCSSFHEVRNVGAKRRRDRAQARLVDAP